MSKAAGTANIDIQFDPEQLRRKYLEERDKRLRPEGTDQYIDIKEYAEYADDPHVAPGFKRDPIREDVDVVIVGGGFSGILAANSFLKLGINNIRVIEKAGDFGGTWYWNRYPGCQCDVEAYTYFPLIEDYGQMPVNKYSRSSEIFDHAKRIGKSLGLYEKSYFQTGVTAMRWDEKAARWTVTTDRNDQIRARFVCLATGILQRPKMPDIPGISSFKGHSFHTSRWDFAYTGGDEKGGLTGLKDKRVAMIGTGASAVQAIPHIGEFAKHLYVVQRTPAAVEPRNNKPTDPGWWNNLQQGWWEKRARNFDGFLIGVPQKEDLIQDGWTTGWASLSNAGQGAETVEEAKRRRQMVDFQKMESIRNRIDSVVKDPKTAESLKPYFNWMCKRPLFVDGYFETYNRPNVTLLDTQGKSLDKVTEDSIVFQGKSYPIDCIIYGSGFDVGAGPERNGGFELYGIGGQSMRQAWAGGMRTVLGMFSHGFPNFGIINGLKQAAVTWNITFMMRRQSEHFAAVVKKCLDGNIKSFDPKPEAEDKWIAQVKSKMSADYQAFLRDCTPGYYNNEGKNQTDSIFLATYGGGPFEYMEIMDEWRDKKFAEELELVPNRPA